MPGNSEDRLVFRVLPVERWPATFLKVAGMADSGVVLREGYIGRHSWKANEHRVQNCAMPMSSPGGVVVVTPDERSLQNPDQSAVGASCAERTRIKVAQLPSLEATQPLRLDLIRLAHDAQGDERGARERLRGGKRYLDAACARWPEQESSRTWHAWVEGLRTAARACGATALENAARRAGDDDPSREFGLSLRKEIGEIRREAAAVSAMIEGLTA